MSGFYYILLTFAKNFMMVKLKTNFLFSKKILIYNVYFFIFFNQFIPST